MVTPNGLDVASIPDLSESRGPARKAREQILAAAAKFLRRPLPADTKILMISGRYEFHNKGVRATLLQTLGRMEKEMTGPRNVLALLCLIGGHMDLIPALQAGAGKPEGGPVPIATHRLSYEASDPILETCSRLGLKNSAQNRVSVIFNPAYLNGHDGLFDMTYCDILSGCDLGVFPLLLTLGVLAPRERRLHAAHRHGGPGGLRILGARHGGREPGHHGPEAAREGHGVHRRRPLRHSQRPGPCRRGDSESRREARRIAVKASWETFYPEHLRAFEKALAGARSRASRLGETRGEMRHVFSSTGSNQPHFRTFTAVVNLPQKIIRLRELAYNLWWS